MFTLLIATTVAIGELLVRMTPNSYSYKDEYIRTKGNEISTLILGDSHNYYAINPKCFGDSTFNLANVSQNYEYDYRLLSAYIPLMPNLRTVILSMSYGSLRDPIFEDGDEWWYASNYKIYMGIDKHSNFSRYNLEFSQPDIFSGRLRRALFGGNANCDSLGMSLDNSSANYYPGWEKQSKKRALKQTISNPKYRKINTIWLERICRLCHEHNLQICLVTTPLYIDYRNHMNKQQMSEVIQIAELMGEKYGAIYFNYMDDKRFDYKDFFDADHLIDSGAKRFSLILRQDIENSFSQH